MVDYTDYQQRALYGAGQAAQRAGQRFHMERDALQRGDTAAAKYHRSRANALNRQGAYAAVRGMGGNQGANPYFGVDSSGQPIRTAEGVALSSAGRDIFDRFRDTGFVEPIRQKKRYAPNTEPRGLEFLMDQAMKNTMFAKMASSIFPKKDPEPDDAYYKSLYGDGLNELYGPSGIFTMGKFLGKPDLDPYYTGDADIPQDYKYYIEPPITFPEPYTYKGEFTGDPRGNVDSGYYGIGPSSYMDDLTEKIVEEGIDEDTITNTYLEEVVNPEKVPLYNLDQYYQLNPTAPGLFGFNISDYSGVQEYINSIVNDPDNPNYKGDVKEILKKLIKDGYVVEGRSD